MSIYSSRINILNLQVYVFKKNYNNNSDISDINHFSGIIWASKVIGKLIKISMELCDKRNRALHGTTSEEKHRIQRGRAIHIFTNCLRKVIGWWGAAFLGYT